jgi:O-antigen/teichoic acid export membrane protein
MGAEATGLVVSILWAANSPTAWALVVGRVSAELFFTIGTHAIANQRVSLQWDPVAAKEILAFGAGMFASSATYFLAGESERLVVGKFVSLVVFGCFSLALSITTTATAGVQRILQQVFYPIISSSLRSDQELAARQFRKTRLALLLVCGGMALVFIVGGKQIVSVLLGPRYVMAGWIVQLLGFRAALELFTAVTTYMLFAFGTSKYAAAGNLAKLAFLAVGLTIAFTRFGFREAIWVLAISPLLAYIPLLYGIRKHFRGALWTEILTLSLLIGSGGLAALLLHAIGQ